MDWFVGQVVKLKTDFPGELPPDAGPRTFRVVLKRGMKLKVGRVYENCQMVDLHWQQPEGIMAAKGVPVVRLEAVEVVGGQSNAGEETDRGSEGQNGGSA